jgi:hypothetical protein
MNHEADFPPALSAEFRERKILTGFPFPLSLRGAQKRNFALT